MCVGRLETLAANTSCSALVLENGITLEHLELKNKRHNCSTDFIAGSKVCLDALEVTTPPVTTIRKPEPVVIPKIVIVAPSCNGNWTAISVCDASCGEAGNLQQTFTKTENENYDASLCPTSTNRLQPCTSNACICPQTPILNCQLKQNNNNVLLCQLSTKPKASATVQVTSGQSDLTIDKCSLTFTNATWNVPQSITMNPLYNTPIYLNSTDININYAINAHGESFNHCYGSFTGKRVVDNLLANTGYCAA